MHLFGSHLGPAAHRCASGFHEGKNLANLRPGMRRGQTRWDICYKKRTTGSARTEAAEELSDLRSPGLPRPGLRAAQSAYAAVALRHAEPRSAGRTLRLRSGQAASAPTWALPIASSLAGCAGFLRLRLASLVLRESGRRDGGPGRRCGGRVLFAAGGCLWAWRGCAGGGRRERQA
jgi:hypothetical protein